MNHTCSKKYSDLPFAHRQHRHTGHCRFIHGHNWSFAFTFACKVRDYNGFVIDFGDLKWLKEWLTKMFDHTLVLNIDDPYLDYLKGTLTLGPTPSGSDQGPFADIRVVPNAGAEGLAQFVFEEVDALLRAHTSDRVFLQAVTVGEDERNSATYSAEGCRHE